MALIKEDYGLIYNDDGSLCTTARDDDIPFQGVKSYAVEESTENLVFNYLNYSSIEGDKPQSYSNSNQNVYKYSDTRTFGKILTVDIKDTIVSDGESLSVSGWLKYVAGTLSEPATYIIKDDGSSIYLGGSNVPKDGNWHYFKTTWTNTSGSDITIQKVWADITGATSSNFEGYAFQIQVEKKPFATSFVDGSRPEGKKNIDGKKIGLSNGILNNHVVSFWFKVPKVQDGELFDSGNWSNVGEAYPIYTHDVSSGSNNYQNFPGNYALGISRMYGNLHYFNRPSDSYSTIRISLGDKGQYENIWHNFIICYYTENGYLVVKSYYDGELIKESFQDLSQYPSLRSEYLYFYGYYRRSNLISNLFIGKYKDDNGNVIWTDEYIQEVYEAKKPFNTNL